LDPVNGGMFLAVNKDGAPITTSIAGEVWAYADTDHPGTDKTQVGQATCIRYFIQEYQRTSLNGVNGINELLPQDKKLSSSKALLEGAKNCANFAMQKMVIQDQSQTATPNALYYWGVVSDDGSKQWDDSSKFNTTDTYRTESSLSWSLAELAYALKTAGAASSEYQPYLDGALNWWNWRNTRAAVLDEDYKSPDFSSGAGRDFFYPNLGFTLTDITGNKEYRDGNGSNMADGKPYGAIPLANFELGTGNAPDIAAGEPEKPLQERTYTGAQPRGYIFTKHAKSFPSGITDRDQWWDFGTDPHIISNGSEYEIAPTSSITDAQLKSAFRHYAGRELLAGVIRSFWYYAAHGANPNMPYISENTAPDNLSKANFLAATKTYWDFTNEKLWDDTPGKEAWLEAVGAPYKPCFSGDNDVPIGDWRKPVIGDKVHTLNGNNSATVTVSGVNDPSTPYLGVDLPGSGIKNVEVVYTADRGKTWIVLPTSFNGTN
jgi:hypothetical protein